MTMAKPVMPAHDQRVLESMMRDEYAEFAACLFGEFEGELGGVGGCDDVAAAVGVDLYRADCFSDLDVEVRLKHAGRCAYAVEAVD